MFRSLKNGFQNKTVLITGHTGFKGAWLSIWLKQLGAHVVGYSLEPATTPNLFELAAVEKHLEHHYGDVRDLNHLKQVIRDTQPDVIFHLAAQSIVLNGFERPHETFFVNAGGTVNLLEAARDEKKIKAIVIATTDKCYENNEWFWGYREIDPLGGNDPYSASKAMAELAVKAYRECFFKGRIPVATARAGNVVGGGDFSPFRLVPDCMRALMQQRPIEVRNPDSVRPWLHVLDPLHGYLMIAQKLMEKEEGFDEPWNFGPLEHASIPVRQMVETAIELWGNGDWIDASNPEKKPEMGLLKLNWDKAANRLRWQPRYDWKEALRETVEWFKVYSNAPDPSTLFQFCIEQIEKFNEIHTPAFEWRLSH